LALELNCSLKKESMNTVKFVLLGMLMPVLVWAGESNISVTVNNPTTTSFYVSHVENFFSDEEIGYMFNLSGNSSEFSITLDAPKFVAIKYDQATIRLFVQPGDRQQLSFEGSDPLNTLQFSGAGAANNTAMQRFMQNYGSDYTNRMYSHEYLPTIFKEELVEKAGILTEAQYFAHVDQVKRDMQSAVSGGNVSFQSFMRTWLDYEAAANKLLYYHVNKYMFRGAELHTAIKTAEALSGIQVSNENALKNPGYVKFLSTYILALNNGLAHNAKGIEFNLFDLANKNLEGKAKAFIKTKLLFKTFRFGQTDLAQEQYKSFSRSNPYQEYNAILEKAIGSDAGFAEAGFAPDFTLTDENGRSVSLSQYKGKVIYLSFWATWCKPCLKGFEKSYYIRQKLEERGIVLINVSIDKKETTWRSTMERIKMPGINLLDSSDMMMKKYNLTSLPVYHIIDKNGQYAFLPTDGVRDIVEEFTKLARE